MASHDTPPDQALTIAVGPITFSEWVPWAARPRLATPEPQLGVYLWAHSHKVPPHPYPNLPRELIYVGETKNLNTRPLGPRTHHRLAHYRKTYPADSAFQHLYVCVFKVEEYKAGDLRCRTLRAFTRYVEDLIYWEYVQKFGKRAALDYAAKRGHRQVTAPCCTRAVRRNVSDGSPRAHDLSRVKRSR